MSDPKQKTVFDAFVTQLKTILHASGYNTDLGNNVYAWRDTDLQESELPGMIVREADDQIWAAFQEWQHTMTVMLEVFGNGDDDYMRQIIADVVKCVGSNLTLTGVVEDIEPPGAAIDVRKYHADKIYWHIKMQFRVIYLTAQWDPYA